MTRRTGMADERKRRGGKMAQASATRISDMPGAERPHCHSPMTAGEATRQLLALHPRGHEATRDEIETLVEIFGRERASDSTDYGIGGRHGGSISNHGTFATIIDGVDGKRTASATRTLGFSATMPLLYDNDDVPEDTTVRDRMQILLRQTVSDMGEDPAIVDVLRVERLPFAGDDQIVFASPASSDGEHSFHGFFSHITAMMQKQRDRLVEGAREIVGHHRHQAEIRRRVEAIHARVVEVYAPLGSEVEDTRLLLIDIDKDIDLAGVTTVTMLTTLDDSLEWRRVMLSNEDPVTGQLVDRNKSLAKDLRRRLKILDARRADEVRTICPVLAETLEGADAETAKLMLTEIDHGMRGGRDDDDPEPKGVIANGFTIRDGVMCATVAIGGVGTWRNRKFLVAGQTLPDTAMAILPGRRLGVLCDDPRIADMVVHSAKNDTRGRLSVTVRQPRTRSLRDVVESLERKVAAG